MELKPGSHIHFMGICGTAMGSLAGLMKEMGYKVTGSDRNVYPPMSTQLQSLGIEIMQDYKKENLQPRPDLVIVGNVISKHFEEAQALLDSGIPYKSLPEAMGEFVIEDRESVVVCGTHGKTTTTSLMAWVLQNSGLEPGFMVGGIPLNFGQSFAIPKASYFVIEGDEYDTAFFAKVPKFMFYKPKHVILTSIEFDHADIYADMEDIRKSFRELMKLIPENGTLVYHAADPEVVEVARLANCKTVGYGIQAGDYQVCERESVVGRNQFAVIKEGLGKVADVAIKFFGEHNTLNALATYALCDQMGLGQAQILNGLASFKGVKRRQEHLGSPGGIHVIEDFAHHPTAVALTIDSIREMSPQGRVIAVFEPRSATARRKVFQDDFTVSLSRADMVAVAQAFDQSKISESERFSSAEVVEAISEQGKPALVGESPEAIITWVKQNARCGDTVLIMSNGGFGGIYQKMLGALAT
jgi:UDP-N-acetylmuramate: L-alanyl-gamma-D-glutamyl-meso-diaminopimelate ligase